MPTEPNAALDSEVVRAWLTALDFLTGAEIAAKRQSRINHAVAVVLADAAAEAALGIIAQQGDQDVPEKADYSTLWRLAAGHRPLTKSLRDRLRTLHRHRNYVLHQAGTVDERHASAGTKVARELVNELGSLVAGVYDLPPKSGPATAVAELLRFYAPEISHALADLDTKLAAGAWKDACQAAAYALDMARARCDPPLIWSQARPPLNVYDPFRHDEERRRQEQETSIVASGLGVSVSEYTRLREVIGRTTGLRNKYPPSFHGGPSDPDPDDTERAARQIVDIVFRLWETGAMQSGTTPVYQMMAARGIIPDVFG